MRITGAFTLIELLIVVAIIAILAAIAVPNFLEAQTRSKVSRVKGDMRSLGTAVESYYVDYGKYPYCYSPYVLNRAHSAQHCFLDVQWQDPGNRFGRGAGNILTTPISYIAAIPWDPFTSQAYRTPPPAGWGWPGPPMNCTVLYGYGYQWDFPVDICGGPMVYQDAGWDMYSCGPHLTLSWPIVIYDPTNGTVSRGLIVYMGKGRGFINTSGFESPAYANIIYGD
jgi:prepilin-type N-terminal cleavage/methylation domain-containing protein